jgi:hypothetical protein
MPPASLEARQLFALVRRGETVNSVRTLIGNDSPYRCRVRMYFDALVERVREQKRLARAARLRIYSQKKIAQAEALLRAGKRWRDVTEIVGCSLATLQRRVTYRKRKKLTPQQLEAASLAMQRGGDWNEVARNLGVSRQTLQPKIAWRKRSSDA